MDGVVDCGAGKKYFVCEVAEAVTKKTVNTKCHEEDSQYKVSRRRQSIQSVTKKTAVHAKHKTSALQSQGTSDECRDDQNNQNEHSHWLTDKTPTLEIDVPNYSCTQHSSMSV